MSSENSQPDMGGAPDTEFPKESSVPHLPPLTGVMHTSHSFSDSVLEEGLDGLPGGSSEEGAGASDADAATTPKAFKPRRQQDAHGQVRDKPHLSPRGRSHSHAPATTATGRGAAGGPDTSPQRAQRSSRASPAKASPTKHAPPAATVAAAADGDLSPTNPGAALYYAAKAHSEAQAALHRAAAGAPQGYAGYLQWRRQKRIPPDVKVGVCLEQQT